ncbi:MAG TPA: ABC-three component system protein [Thermoanaerobaculia bacterium]|nr:ABC-three component system protein [Thermoanaerobaculia bacterium]
MVHNSIAGVPAPLLDHLLTLQQKHLKDCTIWGFEPIKRLVFQLDADDLPDLFGCEAPTMAAYIGVSFAEIGAIVAAIASTPLRAEAIHPVPAEKESKFEFSDDSKLFLNLGRQRSDRVAAYFAEHVDPEKGDRIAAAFKQRYRELAAVEPNPNFVLQDLHDFAAGIGNKSTSHDAAAWAVLSYLFERCEIFTVEESIA